MAAVELTMDWSNYVDLSDLNTDQQSQASIGDVFDIVFSVIGTAVDVRTWSFAALIAPDVDSAPAKQWTDASFGTKTVGGSFTLSVITADTSSLPGRSYFLEIRRVDSGNNLVISKGFLTLSPSPAYTPTTLPTTILRTSLGGTGADLSASGPGVLIQATAGANVTDLTGDLTNSTYYLRKDLTWGIPAGLSGAGTVTSVAVATANGISGSVATATTTPTITLTLGAITPSSIAASGTISGSNLSGTNTGDQTNISGNAATVSVIDAGADTTCWLLFANSQTGNLSPATNANATFNAATGVVSLASPAFSGTPTAPTATLGTNTTQIATTAFVLANASTGTPTAITVANEATDTTCFLGFFTAATGDLGPKTNAALTFNANTANLGCTTFTGTLVGNASTATLATNATNSAITNDTSTNATMYPTWVTTTTGNLPLKMSSTKFTFNPSTGNLTATMFTGALVGNADTATLAGTVSTNANLTGPITSVGNATSIASQTGTGTTFAMSAGPTFTGVPAAPTASPGTNTTQLATTAFVAAAVTAGVPTAITVANEAIDTTCFPLFATAATGDLGPKSNASLTFNSNTANLGCTTFTGALVGNASTASAVAVGGITGLGTGVATALAINVGSAGAPVTFNGAGGTPSSITLSNGTALPIAGLTASTSTALGVGSIELGHATDTTISRSASGKIAVEGKAVPLMSGAVDAVFAGLTATRTYTFPDADTTFAAAVVGANPSASVGLTAVNGSASTFLRSDGAPALSQAIAPTWTGVHTFTPAARTSGSAAYLTINAPADTTLAASTEAIGINHVGATRQFATGALTTQREYVFAAPTYGFVGASTLTKAATVEITDSPAAGTNATVSNTYALWVKSTRTTGNVNTIQVDNSGNQAVGVSVAMTGAGAYTYGLNSSVTGAATTNYGFAVSVSGATSNYGVQISVNAGATNRAVYSAGSAISEFAADILVTTAGTTSTSVATLGATQTFTGKTMIASTNVVEEITSTASSATPTPTGGSLRNLYTLTALAAGATFAAPSGTPVDGNYLTIRVKDNGGAQTLAYNGIYAVVGVTAPLTTVAGKWLYLGCRYNGTASKWHIISVAQEA